MLVESGVASCPKIQQKRSRPREDEIAVMDFDALVYRTRTAFGIWCANPLSELLDFKHWQAGITWSGAELLHREAVLIACDI